MTTDKDREEARKFLRQLEDESNKIANELFVMDVFSRVRAEAKAEAQSEIEALKREIDLCYSMWTGRDYGHLPLHEALGKAMADREANTLREAANPWNKYPDVKPKDGQKVLCLVFGTDIFPATFIESSNKKLHGWFPEVDCISVAGDTVGRMDATNPCFEGDVDYWMEYPGLPNELVRDSYRLPDEPNKEE